MGTAAAISPSLLGYKQLQQMLGLSRSSIERMVRDGRFPKPFRPTPNRRAWHVDVVQEWLKKAGSGLAGVAVTDPNDLEPEQLEDQARDLAAQALSKRTGKPVESAALSLHLTQVVTEEAIEVMQREEIGLRRQYLADLPPEQALLLTLAMLPQLRGMLEPQASPEVRAALNDPKGVEIETGSFVDYLTLFDLYARLKQDGLRLQGGQWVLERLADFDQGRAMVLAAYLLPVLRPLFAAVSQTKADQELFGDETEIDRLAMAALDDEKWLAASAGLRKRQAAGAGKY